MPCEPSHRRSSPGLPSRARAVAAMAILLAIGAVYPTPDASAAPEGPPVDAGDVVITDVDGRPLSRGGSATEFSLQLPEGAACPGDSMHDHWVAQSFVVPASADPGTLKYGVIGPEGEAQYALYMLDTAPFVDAFTLANDGPGRPGQIPMPAFTFNEFPPGTLPDGEYHIGIACTYLERQTAMYWNTEIIVTASPEDEPGQLTWRLTNAPVEAERSGGSSLTWIVLAIGGAILAAALGGFAVRRAASRRFDSQQLAHSPRNLP